MKTTVDLPEEVLRKAKIAAVERKTTLKELICKSLLREIDGGVDPTTSPNDLATAFSRGNNTDAPVGRLRREGLYDRQGLH